LSKDIAVEILKVVDFDNGVFVECGANDGLFMNNTWVLESQRGWTGLLVEPSPSAFEACVKNRPNSIVLNYALVSNDYPLPSITGDFDGHPMSSVDGKRRFNSSPSNVTVMATTLSKLLEVCEISQIDLFSLDVEG
jgi:FkbM family methyltransferase